MRLRVLLVSNYLSDGQQSMLRFASMMEEGLMAKGHQVAMTRPLPILGRVFGRHTFAGKWAGYFDKFIVFPSKLRSLSAEFDVAHVCDHSNAPYRRRLRSRAVVVTCHDLLAVRGALGEETFCPASFLGRRLQASILSNLAAIRSVACDSAATLQDFTRLTGRSPGPSLRTIPLGFGSSFSRVAKTSPGSGPDALGLDDHPYLMHVGSSQPRKNREAILRTVAVLASKAWDGLVVFVGEPLSPSQISLASSLGISSRVRQLGTLSDDQLSTVYAGARAFLFPSFCEGFGWPVLEAQACGCPVICSNRTSLPEVAGEAGIVLEPDDVTGMGDAVLRLGDPEYRRKVVAAGYENVSRFEAERMVDDYLDLYRIALSEPASPS